MPAGLTLFTMESSNDRLFMLAYDSNAKGDLWISDGTAAGTRHHHDFQPAASAQGLSSLMGLVGNRLLMVVRNAPQGVELWTLDTLETGPSVPGSGKGAMSSSGSSCAGGNGASWLGVIALLAPVVVVYRRASRNRGTGVLAK
jgi:ELWxxDGT repeat protein